METIYNFSVKDADLNDVRLSDFKNQIVLIVNVASYCGLTYQYKGLEFCDTNYGISFKIMNKINVNGRKTDPFYNFLKKQKPGIAGTSQIKWNFTKFLVNRSGQVIERFGPQVEASEIEKSIEKNL
jgi:glutathione peroxidase